MSRSPRHLVLFSCVTAGKQRDELGSDESQIVMIAYLLYDVVNNKVLEYNLFTYVVCETLHLL